MVAAFRLPLASVTAPLEALMVSRATSPVAAFSEKATAWLVKSTRSFAAAVYSRFCASATLVPAPEVKAGATSSMLLSATVMFWLTDQLPAASRAWTP